jgi:hypothetical protein
MMELYEKVENVKSREDLILFLFQLRIDLKNNKEEWENNTLEGYLESMENWVEDLEGYYLNLNQQMPDQPSWNTIARILFASSRYE